MATSASNEASEIRRRGRQRLIGAVAIVLLLVVFVPMVLDSEPRPPRNEPALTIPPRNNPPPLPAPAPTAATPPRTSAPVVTPTPTAPTAAPAPAASAPAAEPPKPASVTPEAAAKSPPLEGFAVQVGAFREDDKLRQARDKLAAAGIVHYTERLDKCGWFPDPPARGTVSDARGGRGRGGEAQGHRDAGTGGAVTLKRLKKGPFGPMYCA